MQLMVCSCWSPITQDYLLRDGTVYSGLGPLTSIIKKRSILCSFSSVWSPSSKVTEACVKLKHKSKNKNNQTSQDNVRCNNIYDQEGRSNKRMSGSNCPVWSSSARPLLLVSIWSLIVLCSSPVMHKCYGLPFLHISSSPKWKGEDSKQWRDSWTS